MSILSGIRQLSLVGIVLALEFLNFFEMKRAVFVLSVTLQVSDRRLALVVDLFFTVRRVLVPFVYSFMHHLDGFAATLLLIFAFVEHLT